MNNVNAIRATGVAKSFEATRALDGVDLILEEGEVRGLLGPNGAGKTTLLRILFGLVRPDAGAIELFGQAVDGSESRALDRVSGFVEDPSFYPYLSGRANLELLVELDRRETGAMVDEVLEQVGLATRSADRVSGYSTGMRQRLGIAASLLRSPRLLLLDEPTAGLDPEGVREIGALVRKLAADRVAVLVSSHLIAEVEDFCQSFTVLRRGRVVWDGRADQVGEQAPASAHRLLTSDDARALEIAARYPGVSGAVSDRGGLTVTVDEGSLDQYVLALGSAGVAVRRLELLVSPLESMFFALTSERENEATPTPEPAGKTHADP